MPAIQGWGGQVVISSTPGAVPGRGTSLPVLSWGLAYRSEALDAMTMGHQGFCDYVHGPTEFDITFQCLYDTTLNPFRTDADPRLAPGETSGVPSTSDAYYSLNLTMDRSNQLRVFYFPRVTLTDVQVEDEVKGVVKYSVAAKSTRSARFRIGSEPSLGGVPITPTATPG